MARGERKKRGRRSRLMTKHFQRSPRYLVKGVMPRLDANRKSLKELNDGRFDRRPSYSVTTSRIFLTKANTTSSRRIDGPSEQERIRLQSFPYEVWFYGQTAGRN